MPSMTRSSSSSSSSSNNNGDKNRRRENNKNNTSTNTSAGPVTRSRSQGKKCLTASIAARLRTHDSLPTSSSSSSRPLLAADMKSKENGKQGNNARNCSSSSLVSAKAGNKRGRNSPTSSLDSGSTRRKKAKACGARIDIAALPSMRNLQKMSYRQLQLIAISHGVSGNIRRRNILAELERRRNERPSKRKGAGVVDAYALSKCKKKGDSRSPDIPLPSAVGAEILIFLGLREMYRLRTVSRQFLEWSDTAIKGIRELNIIESDQLNDSILMQIATQMPLLETFDLSGNFDAEKRSRHFKADVGDAGIHALAQRCSNLWALDLRGCRYLSNAGIDKVAILLGDNLECIHLGDGRGGNAFTVVTDAAMASIGDNCQIVRHVDISACTEITADGILDFAQGCTYIEHLNVSSCSSLSWSNINTIMGFCPELHRLVIPRHLECVVNGARRELVKMHPNLKCAVSFDDDDCYHSHECVAD